MRGSDTVIVVDDDPQVLRSLSFLLEIEGFNVLAFGSGAELLSQSEFPLHGCFVIDYSMPRMNGLELIGKLRDRAISLPVILITGQLNDGIDDEANKMGATQVVRKPHLNDDLINGIAQALCRSE
jgi:FixJ family two-component response regulator